MLAYSGQLVRCNLWRIWLIIFLISLNIYLIYNAIIDYVSLKKLALYNWSLIPLNLKLSCLIVSIALLPLTILTMIIVTGNLSNDGHILGKDNDNHQFIFDSDSKGRLIRLDNSFNQSNSSKSASRFCCWKQSICKQQFLPVSLILHLISSLCFIIPIPFIEAQKIKNLAMKQNSLWHSDLDFMFNPDQNHQQFIHQKIDEYQQPMSPAYFTFVISLCLLSYRYPSVFWRTNHVFCILFTLSMVLLSFNILFEFSATSILIKLSYNSDYVVNELRPTVDPFILMCSHVLSSLILLLGHTTIFNYGLKQYFKNLAKHRQNLRVQFKKHHLQQYLTKQTSEEIGEDPEEPSEQEEMEILEDEEDGEQFKCKRYLNLTFAVIFGLFGMALKTGSILNCMRIYSITGDCLLYFNIISMASFGIFWIFLWFGLSLYTQWNFKIALYQRNIRHYSTYKCSPSFLALNNNSTIPTNPPSTRLTMVNLGTVNENSILRSSYPHLSSPLYTNCQPRPSSTIPTTTTRKDNFSPNELRKSSDSYDGTEMSSCYNYVFMHNVASPINKQHILQTNSGMSPVPSNSGGITYASVIKQIQPTNQRKFPPNNDMQMNSIANQDDTFGSENSYNSNFSRSIQDKVQMRSHQLQSPEQQPLAVATTNEQFNDQQPIRRANNIINRYFAGANDSRGGSLMSANHMKAMQTQSQFSLGRSPLLSYRPSNDSSPASSGIQVQNSCNNNNMINGNHQIRDNFDLAEPDIISHRNSNDVNKDENEYDDAMGSITSSIIVKTDPITPSKMQNINQNFNDLSLEDEDERLCSQV